MNKGNISTFVPDPLDANKKASLIDLTFATPRLAGLIANWKVLTEDSHSDHRWIQFDMAARVPEVELIRFKKSTDWDKFTKLMEGSSKLKDLRELSFELDCDQLDEAAEVFMKDTLDSYHKSCRKRRKPVYKKQKWFNFELYRMRKRMRTAFRRSVRAPNREALRIEARRLKALYFSACEKAKRKSWRDTVEEQKDISRLHKFMEKGATDGIASIVKADGTYTTNAADTQRELMREHFEGAAVLDEDQSWRDEPTEHLGITESEIILEATTMEIIYWSIESFSPYKSPGTDEVFPALLQKAKGTIAPILQTLFRASLLLG